MEDEFEDFTAIMETADVTVGALDLGAVLYAVDVCFASGAVALFTVPGEAQLIVKAHADLVAALKLTFELLHAGPEGFAS